jgi:hypothetical protein
VECILNVDLHVREDKLTRTIFKHLKNIFGVRLFDVLMERIEEDYLGDEMTVRMAVMKRPDLFERAFIDMLGEEAGVKILANVWQRVLADLHCESSDSAAAYSKKGDLAKCITEVTRDKNYYEDY